jgi:hypothetical protein
MTGKSVFDGFLDTKELWGMKSQIGLYILKRRFHEDRGFLFYSQAGFRGPAAKQTTRASIKQRWSKAWDPLGKPTWRLVPKANPTKQARARPAQMHTVRIA